MFLEKFTYNKADIIDLSVNLVGTESDLTTKLLKRISYINYFKFVFYKIFKLCFFFSYAFFFVFTILYFVFILIYEKIYDKMGIGAGENYRKEVLIYNKKIKEWIEYITKV